MSPRAGWRRPRRFLGEGRANAAMEFALVAPVLILLGLGAVEFSAAVRAQLNIGNTARYVAGILQNQTSVSAAQLQDYFVAGQYMYANGGADGTLALSAVSVKFTNEDANGNAQAQTTCTSWDASAASTTPAYTAMPTAALNNDTSLSDGLDNDSTIIVEASAVYTMPFIPNFRGFVSIPSSFTFKAISRVRPRYVLQIPTNPSPGFSQC